jgi:hypothetical protein
MQNPSISHVYPPTRDNILSTDGEDMKTVLLCWVFRQNYPHALNRTKILYLVAQ